MDELYSPELRNLQEQHKKIQDEIDAQYWTFTRSDRGRPVDGVLYILRNENEQLIKDEIEHIKKLDVWPYPLIDNLYRSGDPSWHETSERIFYNQLGAVPPARQNENAFAVGECWTHDDNGGLHAMFVTTGGRFFCRVTPLRSFDSHIFTQEVKAQFGIQEKRSKE